MLANLKYLRTVLRHKWYVLRYGWEMHVPLWRLIKHDWTKFTRAEWPAYVERFASGRAGKEDKELDPTAFKDAWKHHWQNNPHHWEFWVRPRHISTKAEVFEGRHMVNGDTVNSPVPMPDTYVREMVADWRAASKAYGGNDNPWEWYDRVKDKQMIHPDSRREAESLMRLYCPR